jgi:hypothetical protein
MAIFNQQVDPEKILGMKPEDLKTKLESAASKEDVTNLGKQFETISSGLQELKNSLAALKPKEPEAVIVDEGDPTTNLLLDPKKFVKDETKVLQSQQIETQAQLQEMRARQNPALAGIFSKYGSEMVALAEKMPLAQRAQPGFWEWHARTFVGDKVVTGKLDRESYPSLIGSSTVGVRSDGDQGDPNMGFDAPVAEWLKGRNIPLAKAAKIHQIMGKDGDTISIANYKAGNA